MDQSIPEKRRSSRANVLLSATIELDGESLPVTLRNLSAEGALVTGVQLPKAGASVLFCRNDLAVESCIVWVHAQHAGVKFSQLLNQVEVLQNVPKPPQRSIVPQQCGRPGFACRALTEEEKRMVEEWASAPSSTRLGD